MNFLKIWFLKIFSYLVISVDGDSSTVDRIDNFFKGSVLFSLGAFIMSVLDNWFMKNQEFTAAVFFLIGLNMFLGGVMHFRKGDFRWDVLILKTILMVVVVNIAYFVLEIILSFAGEGTIITGFRAALQIATLLYPGAKILKQVFILSNGEHPPQWIMDKIYNFQANGDLEEFLKNKK